MSYRRRPGTHIEASQFLADSIVPSGVQWEDGKAFVVTAHCQRVYVEFGDWIVREPRGDGYYPIKPIVFEQTYEWVNDD